MILTPREGQMLELCLPLVHCNLAHVVERPRKVTGHLALVSTLHRSEQATVNDPLWRLAQQTQAHGRIPHSISLNAGPGDLHSFYSV
jgi:hypothetical protein